MSVNKMWMGPDLGYQDEKSCSTCLYEHLGAYDHPCRRCVRIASSLDMWASKNAKGD